MTSFAPLSPETLEDRSRYLEGHLAEVACLDCLAKVRVRKQSEFHTSIQWDDAATSHCAEFTKARSQGDGRVQRSCTRLLASIDRAVRDGEIEIGGTVD